MQINGDFKRYSSKMKINNTPKEQRTFSYMTSIFYSTWNDTISSCVLWA